MGQASSNQVRVCDNVTEEEFKRIVRAGMPMVLKNCDFGGCMRKWNLEYLTDKLGDQVIEIHEFWNDKELVLTPPYEKCQFKYLSRRLKQLDSSYTPNGTPLTSLEAGILSGGYPRPDAIHFSTANKTHGFKDPTKIEDVFPVLREDLQLPSFLPLGKDKTLYDSSVLRIASRYVDPMVDYDLLPFVFCQVAGLNRVLLWSRNEEFYDIVGIMYDRALDNFVDKNAPFGNTNPLMCFLYPGDCLFIPKLWYFSMKTFRSEFLDPIAGLGKMPKATDPMVDYSIAFSIYWHDSKTASTRERIKDELKKRGPMESFPFRFF